jgi:2',3'-cyclic-nucleotide 2'-phosphodiesterase (5'-nucleotidase family)
MKNLKNAVFLIILVILTSCKSEVPQNLKFTIIQLNDVYEISPIQGGKYGGMARVETLHKKLLEENPNTLLVLAGDFLNPSLLGTIKVNGERVRGKQMVEVMNAMNFDLVAFGNHEFDLSYENLQNRLNESKFEWICSNVYHNLNGEKKSFGKIIEGEKKDINQTYIKEFKVGSETIKIGFISVCIPSNPRSYVTYTDMFEEAKRTYNDLKDKTDIVLGLTHVKIEDDKKIAEMLPGIPLIMGGHEHTNKYEKVGNSLITKADANAKTVYVHKFEYNPTTKQLNFNSELITIDESITDDKDVGAVVSKWENILNSEIKEIIENPNEIIYTTETPLEARDTPVRSVQTNMGEIVAASMSNAYDNKVDCAFVNGGSIRIDDVLLGDISAVDIFRVLPYGGPVLKVQLKGALLEEVLNYGEKSSGTGAYLQRFNISIENDIWLVQNKPIDKDKIYTVATSDYLLKGFDIPFLKPSNGQVIDVYTPTKDEQSFDVRKSVITFLKTK